MWNHASNRGDSSSLLCKAGNVPHFLLKHIVSNRRGPDGCYFNPKLMDLGRFSYKDLKKLLILSLIQRGFRRMRQILNCTPGTEVLFAQALLKSPLCPFSKVFFLLIFLSFKQGRFWACQQEWSPCICCNITKGTNSPDLGIYILPPQSQPTCFSLTQDLFMLHSWLLHSSEELLFLIQEIPNNTETMSLHLDYNIYKGMGMVFLSTWHYWDNFKGQISQLAQVLLWKHIWQEVKKGQALDKVSIHPGDATWVSWEVPLPGPGCPPCFQTEMNHLLWFRRCRRSRTGVVRRARSGTSVWTTQLRIASESC